MRVEPIPATLEALDDLFGFEAICAFLTEDERPFSGALGLVDWRLCGALSRVVKSGFFHAAPSERLLLPTDGRVNAGRIFVVGLGPMSAVTVTGLEHELGKAGEMLEGAGVASVALAFSRLPRPVDAVRDEVLARTFLDGFPGRVGVFGA
jgi:hypothetical protein